MAQDKTHAADMRYQRKTHQIDVLVKDEDARRLKVQLAVLHDENAALKDQVVQKQCEIDQLVSDAAEEKATTHKKSNKQQATKEAELLPEKLALETRVKILEAELSAKAILDHRVKTLEAELSKRSDVEGRVKTLEADLAKERRTTEQCNKQLTEAQGQQELLEEKVAELRAKLKEARAEVKTVRAEMMTTQTVSFTEELPKPKAKSLKAAIKPRRKRRANEMSDDEAGPLMEPVLHTPQQIDARPKRPLKKSLSQTLVGEKSAFSITPFLNKTINFADHSIEFTAGGGATKIPEQEKSASSEPETSGDSMMAQPSQPISSGTPEPTIRFSTETAKVPLNGPKPRGRPPKAKVLGETSASKKNLKTSLRKVFMSEPTLDRVMEEANDDAGPDQENQSTTETTKSLKIRDATMTVKMSDASGVSSSLEPEPKKKKRKLLGGAPKTLFGDGDEANDVAVAVPPAKRKALGSRSIAKGLSGLKRTAFGGSGFSPLKRDRRGVNASFLA